LSDAPLSRDRAKARLNRCIETGVVIYSQHFRQELIDDGLTREDVFCVCRSGAISTPPERDIRSGRWKYRIEGLTVDRVHIAIVFTFRSTDVVFITVFRRSS